MLYFPHDNIDVTTCFPAKRTIPPLFKLHDMVWVGNLKVLKIPKSKIKLHRAQPTHTPTSKLFLETHHWYGQYTQIIMTNNFQEYTCIYIQNTHGILLQNISTVLELFWDDFPKQNKIPSDTWTHFHSKLGYFLCKTLNIRVYIMQSIYKCKMVTWLPLRVRRGRSAPFLIV